MSYDRTPVPVRSEAEDSHNPDHVWMGEGNAQGYVQVCFWPNRFSSRGRNIQLENQLADRLAQLMAEDENCQVIMQDARHEMRKE